MTERERLTAAIHRISERYLPAVTERGDDAVILHWALRLADYSGRLARLVAPPAPVVTQDTDSEVTGLSRDPQVAIAQLLSAIGHPITFTAAGATRSIDPVDIVRDATPEQNRQLALLGVLGSPGSVDGADYTLFRAYYDADGAGNWAPKPKYALGGTWQAYVDSLA